MRDDGLGVLRPGPFGPVERTFMFIEICVKAAVR
jgi:hypothetical protein